jgi:phosphoribosylanthranilate isomerase
MTWVKICGITNLEDALIAVEAGADAVGFVFHEKSPRQMDVETVRAIVEELPGRVEKVGVFVEHNSDEIRTIVERAGLSMAQLHTGKSLDWTLKTSGTAKEAIGADKMILVVPGDSFKGEGLFNLGAEPGRMPYAVLVDSVSADAPGGTGKTFDWEKARGAVAEMGFRVPVIVAGGLTPSNVRAALDMFQPFGVDVVSGVEARPGKKDPEKVRAFVKAVREADRKVS